MALTSEDWLQAQYSVIGSALIDATVVPRVIAETSARDFNGPCLTVYNAIRRVFNSGRPVDPVSVGAIVGPDYREFMVQIMEITPTAANIGQYIQLCREQARFAIIRNLAQQMADADSNEKMRKLLEEANGLMIDRPSVKISTMSDSLRSFMDRHTKQVQYLTWPIRELNDRIYAELGDMIVMGGYPSTGKSAFALQCAWHWAKNYKVGFFSLETSSEKLFDRQMSAIANLSMDDIKRNSIDQAGWEKVCAMTGDITTRNLELVPAAGMTPADVRAVTMQRGYQIIFVDYLQLLQGPGENRTSQVTAISIALHTLAQSMGVTVVALSQLARQGQQNGRPDMSALRESGQIEQDADVVMILSLENKDNRAGNRILDISKNKEGTCPNVLLAFDGKHQTFTKAQQTGDTLSKLAGMNKKKVRSTPVLAQPPAPASEQMTMLPDDYKVPF